MRRQPVSRRQLLGLCGGAITAAVTGCAGVVNRIADQLLEDVNVLNDTDQQQSGTVRVAADGETLLDREFTLNSASGNDENANVGTYADVWTDGGSYEAEVTLQEPIDGEASGSKTITIDNPDEEMLLVGLGLQEAEQPIVFRVGTSFTDVVEG
ncbi:hypothetical protein GRX03_03445 [Halovenus sp. WSH3]|uniref:Uncharacterized protein n=1 Tax=Halovenus carboxidivorans TaxID=2692199 RepID=A0A6B0SYL1_9EURY|nr:hypothetical protein [Halovenus carboxidivorans]MXR50664.1 hypothetical protein [Halovenus carboxidivorans]